IQIPGLDANTDVTLHARTRVNKKCFYESYSHYKVPASGILDLEKQPSIGGSYIGVEPMGFLWSMEGKADREEDIVRLIHKDVTVPQNIDLKVYVGLWDREPRNKLVAETTIQRMYMAPGVKRIDVRENGLVATLFLPKGKKPFPGVITLFGGYPGLIESKAALLASNGFAALGLAYYGTEDLPKKLTHTLDLEYFKNAVKFMTSHEYVSGSVGIVAICRGGSIALAMAACLKDIRCVVAVNNGLLNFMSDIKYKNELWPAFPLNLVPQKNLELRKYFKIPPGEKIENNPSFFPFHARKDISYLFIGGMDDRCMPNEMYLTEIQRLLEKAAHQDYVITRYPKVGHLLEYPYAVHTSHSFQHGHPFNFTLAWGGHKVEHCKAQEESWIKQLEFLRSRL
uniref:BAAT/Acyl-CoA thioester hydrolase C-terminal domain-containing protein n=1 Tax=Ciona savignyi TaxID=51511 RepID=H2ZQD1_CIOSA